MLPDPSDIDRGIFASRDLVLTEMAKATQAGDHKAAAKCRALLSRYDQMIAKYGLTRPSSSELPSPSPLA